MTTAYNSLTYPNGRALIPALMVRRERPLPINSTPFVSLGERVSAERPLAERRDEHGVQSVIAGIAGTVTAITLGRSVTIEGKATLINGALGVGYSSAGALYTIPRGESLAVAYIPHGSVLVHPTRVPLMLLQRALASGASGVIAASASALEIEGFARADLTAVLEGYAPPTPPQPLTVILTEGVGEAVMDSAIWHLLTRRLGDIALLNGQTQPGRAVRPEILLSVPDGVETHTAPLPSELKLGTSVKVWSGGKRGARGRIVHLFTYEQVSSSGQWEPCAQVQFEDGSALVIPLQALDVIG